MYDLIFANTIGASHIRSNIPCQDYGLVKETEDYKVFAVSDGHGDPSCFRSDRGSRFVCETVVDILPQFVDSVWKDNNACLLFELNHDLLKQLSTSIIGNWYCRIEEDIAADPITAETIENFEAATNKRIRENIAEEYKSNIRAERAYGCTLIAGIMKDDFLFLLHHGDGRCIVVDEDGDVIQPVPWDERCVGSITTSCCDRDAIDHIRYSIIPLNKHKIAACFLSSDGVEDSFAAVDAMYSYFLDCILYAIDHGTEELSKYLSETLPELSALGSADDITIAGVMDTELCVPFVEKFKAFSKRVELEVSLEKTEDKIKSILNGGLFAHLKKNYEKLQLEYDNVKQEYDALSASRSALEKSLVALSEQSEQARRTGINDANSLLSFVQNLLNFCKGNFLEDSVNKCVQDLKAVVCEIAEREERIEQLEGKLEEAKKDFDTINKEYMGYVEAKADIEQQLAELRF